MNHRRALLLAKAAPKLDLNFVDGSPFDGRITFTRASGATYFDASGTLQTAATNAARIDYNPSTLAVNGLLIEEQRTNSIRNPRAEGAVAGTPGTVPTNWSGSPSPTQIVGSGTESGLPYVDMRFASASSVTNAFLFDTIAAVAASSGQSWTGSFYCRLVGGTLSNTIFTCALRWYDNAQTFLSQTTTAFTPTSAGLSTQRSTATASAPASTASAAAGFRYTATGAYDFTVRLAGPQLELGAFATSLILPAVGTPAATTRAGDSGSIPVQGASFNAGALASEYQTLHGNASASEYAVQLTDGSDANRYALRIDTTGTQTPQLIVVSSGSVQSSAVGSANTPGSSARLAAAWAQSIATPASAGSVLATASITPPVGVPNLLTIGCTAGSANQANGYVRRVRLWPRALSASELQTVTT